ncbi:hypothetical protein C8Q80DRAFT_1273628 [Daedaleopsis nitida]|nr:hypothetical protein C8Q80DRAFT_1273628 [Daedaleopsis nitida]
MSNDSPLSYGDSQAQAQRNLTVTFLGPVFSGALFGVQVGQTGYYLLHSYRHDRIMIRSLVLSLLVTNLLHTALQFHIVYRFMVFGHQATYDMTDVLMPWYVHLPLVALVLRQTHQQASIILNAFELALVHIFYIHRVWLIGRHKIWTITLSIFVVFTFAQGLLFFVWSLRSLRSYSLMTSVLRIQTAISATFAITDICLTSSLLYLLIRSRTGSFSPNRLVKRLISYTISTGVLTSRGASVFHLAHPQRCSLGLTLTPALSSPCQIIKLPHTVISTCFWYLGSSLYATSLMASLNARESLRAECVADSEFPTAASATMPRFTTAYVDGGHGGAGSTTSITFARPPPTFVDAHSELEESAAPTGERVPEMTSEKRVEFVSAPEKIADAEMVVEALCMPDQSESDISVNGSWDP